MSTPAVDTYDCDEELSLLELGVEVCASEEETAGGEEVEMASREATGADETAALSAVLAEEAAGAVELPMASTGSAKAIIKAATSSARKYFVVFSFCILYQSFSR